MTRLAILLLSILIAQPLAAGPPAAWADGPIVGSNNGVEWDAVDASDLAGYRVYFSHESLPNAFHLDVQGSTGLDFRNLSNPLTTGQWSVAVSAYDVLGNESEKSEPLAFVFDAQAPSVPKNLKIRILVTIP